MASDVMAAMGAWLPVPRYRFVGGPFDGQARVVDLHEMPYGMEPPRVWRIPEDLGPPSPTWKPLPVATDVECRVHDYEFVPEGSFNRGYYRHRP